MNQKRVITNQSSTHIIWWVKNKLKFSRNILSRTPSGLNKKLRKLPSYWVSIGIRCINGTGSKEKSSRIQNHSMNIQQFLITLKFFRSSNTENEIRPWWKTLYHYTWLSMMSTVFLIFTQMQRLFASDILSF